MFFVVTVNIPLLPHFLIKSLTLEIPILHMYTHIQFSSSSLFLLEKVKIFFYYKDPFSDVFLTIIKQLSYKTMKSLPIKYFWTMEMSVLLIWLSNSLRNTIEKF